MRTDITASRAATETTGRAVAAASAAARSPISAICTGQACARNVDCRIIKFDRTERQNAKWKIILRSALLQCEGAVREDDRIEDGSIFGDVDVHIARRRRIPL